MRIISVIDRPRWGLFNIAVDLKQATEEFGAPAGEILCHRALMRGSSDASPFSLSALFRKSQRGDHIIFWSLGIGFVFSPLFRFFGRKTVYVYHEPATLVERIRKSNEVIRSLLTAILLKAYVPLFCKVLVPNADNAHRHGLPFVRLPIRPTPLTSGPKRAAGAPLHVVFLGARLATRGVDLFGKLETSGVEGCGGKVQFSHFPGPAGYTEADKVTLLQEGRCVVWNVFNVPYNQSAVTLDALKYGLPMLASDFEPLMEDLTAAGAAVFLRRTEVNLDSAIAALRKIDLEYDRWAAGASEVARRWYEPKIVAEEWRTVLED